MLTMDRFLYEVSGYLVFRARNDNAAKRAVVEETELRDAFGTKTWQLEDFTSGCRTTVEGVGAALEHNLRIT